MASAQYVHGTNKLGILLPVRKQVVKRSKRELNSMSYTYLDLRRRCSIKAAAPTPNRVQVGQEARATPAATGYSAATAAAATRTASVSLESEFHSWYQQSRLSLDNRISPTIKSN